MIQRLNPSFKTYHIHTCSAVGCKTKYANTQAKHQGFCKHHHKGAFKSMYRKAIVNDSACK